MLSFGLYQGRSHQFCITRQHLHVLLMTSVVVGGSNFTGSAKSNRSSRICSGCQLWDVWLSWKNSSEHQLVQVEPGLQRSLMSDGICVKNVLAGPKSPSTREWSPLSTLPAAWPRILRASERRSADFKPRAPGRHK